MFDISSPPPDFERIYLQLNSDVYEGVQKGDFSSGWEHYLLFGYREDRPGAAPELQQTVQDLFGDSSADPPLPPSALCKRVHGSEYLSSFERAGKIISLNIHSAIVSAIQLAEHHRVLDFGCGCGRVIRYFYKLHSKSSFYGTDIDTESISWCQASLSRIGTFITNEHWPPLPFSNGSFDFIYSISVFTHLPEDMQFAWLEELRRITKTGGYVILTTHAAELLHASAKEGADHLRQAGFYYAMGGGTEGLPGFYQTAFHTEEYIRSRWSRFFEIEKIIYKGVNNHQDLILLRKTS